jgi:acetoacetyl-CoA synthetase
MKAIIPRETTDLTKLRVVISTGMVLSEALFEWFYDEAFLSHTHLCNIAGGTDIAGCFGIGNPTLPLYSGGCQSPSLGVAVAVYDQQTEDGSQGTKLLDGEAGELVATTAFPNMPTMFWGAEGKEKYMSAYFQRFDSKITSILSGLFLIQEL